MPNPLNGPVWTRFRERALVPAGVRLRAFGDRVRDRDPVFTSFRRPGRAEKAAAGVAVLLIAAVVVFLLLFDWNWLRGPLGRWASDRYDRQIALNGDLDVDLFSWTPSVIARDLRFGGPAWALEADTARVERIEASVRLTRLFAGRVEMPLLSIARPDVVLIVDEQGRRSWALDPDAREDDDGPNLPLIQRLIIEDGRLRFNERRRGLTLDAALNAREEAGPNGRAGFVLDGQGALNRSPLTLQVQGGPFINIRRDRPYDFTAELSGAGSRLFADGSVTRPFDLRRFDATLTLEGRDLADLYLITGVLTPNSPPYRLTGALSRDRTEFRFADFSGRVGSSDLSGDIVVDRIDGRLRVEADLASRALDIADLTSVLGARPTVQGGDTTVTSGAPGKLLPDAPLNVTRLRAMDGRLSYRAASVKRNDLEIRQVALGADLDDAILRLDPIRFTFARGQLNGVATINATRDRPYSAVDFRLAGYPLESIVPARNGANVISGRALGRARLEGPGASISEFAGRSKGSISLVVPEGRIQAAFAELLGINAGAGLRRLLSGDTSSTQVRCAVADFTVAGGTATARTFVVDTDVVLAQGAGTIDLGAETLSLRIDGETKRPRLLRVWAPITVGGRLSQPSIGVDAGALAAQGGLAAGLAALVGPLAALLPFVDPGLAEDADCGGLIASAR